jgi:hypothetical protein
MDSDIQFARCSPGDDRRLLVCPQCGGNVLHQGEPSMHRYGLALKFSCRYCGCVSGLAISPHNGRTLIYWR